MQTIDDLLRSFGGDAAPPRPARPLIAARRVIGVAIYNQWGERLAKVEDLVLDKQTGRVSHVLISIGGIFGFGRKLRTIPWRLLAYDPDKGGYVTPHDRRDLDRAPRFRPEVLSGWPPPVPVRIMDVRYPAQTWDPPC